MKKIGENKYLVAGTLSDGVEVARGGLGLERYWFWRHRGEDGRWSVERFRTRQKAVTAALEYWNGY